MPATSRTSARTANCCSVRRCTASCGTSRRNISRNRNRHGTTRGAPMKSGARARKSAVARQSERAFLSPAEAIEHERFPWPARATLFVLIGLLVVAAAWASFARIDRIVVGRGRLITTTPTIVVQPLEPSMIRSIDVDVGQIVKKGTRLASFDPTFASSDLSQLSVRHASLDAQVARLEAELAGHEPPPATPANAEELLQLRLFQERRGNLESRLGSL